MRVLFSHQGKHLIFSFMFRNCRVNKGGGSEGRRLTELCGAGVERVLTSLIYSNCDAHISKVSTPSAAELMHRNKLAGS